MRLSELGIDGSWLAFEKATDLLPENANGRYLAKMVGVNPGQDPASPLPELCDEYGDRVYLFARSFWTQPNLVPEVVKMAAPKVEVGGHVVRPMVRTGRGLDGQLMRSLTAYWWETSKVVKCTVIGARRDPWTAASAKDLVERCMEGLDVSDASLPIGSVRRIDTSKPMLYNLAHDASRLISDTFTVVGHCVNPTSINSRAVMLKAASDTYGPLINFVLAADKDRRIKPNDPAARNNFFVLAPYKEDYEFGEQFPYIDNCAPRDDEQVFRGWLEFMAEARCSQEWPYRRDIHALVAHFKDALIGLTADQELTAALNELEVKDALLEEAGASAAEAWSKVNEIRQQLTTLIGKLGKADEKVAEADEKVRQAEAASLLNAVRAQQLFDQVDGLEKNLARAVRRAQNLEAGAEEARLAEAAVREENDGLRRALRASESRARAQMAVTDPEAVLRVPGAWDELYECAAQLQNIRMTSSAVEPALGTLDRHTHALNWLERTWIALVALNEFALADHPNFRLFLAEHGRKKLTEAHVTLNEGETVRQSARMSAERIFTTEDGPMEMMAHVKIGSGAPPAPRLHFLKRADEGVVYVGYIGPHLTNTQTN